ncbi:hypothetical protein C8F04DRAFT_1261846 [Mycena alexandri]|uniref:Uncharacterized protein n=1 Tax=Mycena alexandri TaxID=1745969 RepID=A0AAD6SSD4_9AGAR|nr:hypothetical protein C8F04DRAFT_1261846 [Mycena alexandri]
MAPIMFAVISSLCILQALAAPLHRRTFTCSATSRVIGGGHPDWSSSTDVVDSAPLNSTQLSLAIAQKVADQIANSIIFSTLESSPPDNATSAKIVPLFNVASADNTAKLVDSTKFLAKAISDIQNLNCTST